MFPRFSLCGIRPADSDYMHNACTGYITDRHPTGLIIDYRCHSSAAGAVPVADSPQPCQIVRQHSLKLSSHFETSKRVLSNMIGVQWPTLSCHKLTVSGGPVVACAGPRLIGCIDHMHHLSLPNMLYEGAYVVCTVNRVVTHQSRCQPWMIYESVCGSTARHCSSDAAEV
jgi:hypothetical protein